MGINEEENEQCSGKLRRAVPVGIGATSLPRVAISVDSRRTDTIPPILWNGPGRDRGHSLWLLVLVQINPRAVKFIEIAGKSKTTTSPLKRLRDRRCQAFESSAHSSPVPECFLRLKRMAHGTGSVSLSSGEFEMTIPSDHLLSFAFDGAASWAEKPLTILNHYCPVEDFGFFAQCIVVAELNRIPRFFDLNSSGPSFGAFMSIFPVACSHQDTSVMFGTVGDRALEYGCKRSSPPVGEDIFAP